jgi:hypothetical protein
MKHKVDLRDLLKGMPLSLKKEIVRAVTRSMTNAPIGHMKKFIAEYEDDSQIDHMISRICADVISKVGNALGEAVEGTGKTGLCGIIMGEIAVREIRNVADSIQRAIDAVKKDEPTHDCRIHKH